MTISSRYVLAGNATFTIETPTQHRTYRVERVEASARWKEAFFVKLLTGPNNETDWTYLGKLDDFTGQLQLTAKSKLTADAFPVKLFNRVMARVWSEDHAAYEQHGFKTHHEGCCGRCGRTLTTPTSVETGIGPECAKKLGIERTRPEADPFGEDPWKAAFAAQEARQEQLAFMSDPDFNNAYA